MRVQDAWGQEPNTERSASRDWDDEQADERSFHAEMYDAADYADAELTEFPKLRAEPLPIAQVTEIRAERQAARTAATPAAESKMSLNQLESRIEQMEATTLQRRRTGAWSATKPADIQRDEKLTRYIAERDRKELRSGAAPMKALEAITPEERLAAAIGPLVAAYGRPAVIDATWATAKAQPEAWR
jgi:hypothetical protein